MTDTKECVECGGVTFHTTICSRANSRGDRDVADVIAKIDKAHDHVCDLASGREKWTMRIPARPDTDSDLIIGAALSAAREALQAHSSTARVDPYSGHPIWACGHPNNPANVRCWICDKPESAYSSTRSTWMPCDMDEKPVREMVIGDLLYKKRQADGQWFYMHTPPLPQPEDGHGS